jgi:hypothetical protein
MIPISGGRLAVLAAAAVLASGLAVAQHEEDLAPGPGLASRYPGDAGIAADPRVVFAESFEDGSLEAVLDRWESVSNAEIMSLEADTPPGSRGGRSLLMTHVGGRGEGGHLYRRLLHGHDELYVRFYVKFAPDCAPIHHFFHVGGYHPPTPYPQGGAGVRPEGNARFHVGVEPHGNAWAWDYYTYWMEMRGSPPRGQTWGNSFLGDTRPAVRRGEWTSVELMLRMNDPRETNGEMALWIDDRRVSHLGPGFPSGRWIYDKFLPGEGGEGLRWNESKGAPEPLAFPEGGLPFEGFRWRSDGRLGINYLWVLNYITQAPEGHVSRVWFDHIVVAREYIGPLAK